MPIEVERKARVAHPDKVMALLAQCAAAEPSIYHDTYYDWSDGRLEEGRHELRVRVIETDNATRAFVTFKDTPFDHTSVPEHETTIGDADTADAILTGLGLVHVIKLHKRCRNYTFQSGGHDIKATIVQVPELGDETFIEVETIVDTAEQTALAARAIDDVLAALGLNDRDLTDELYTDRVRAHRQPR